MAKADDRDLVQRYFDDELDAEERARFEAGITDDDRERLAALGEMRVLLNAALDGDAAQIDVWSGVEKQLSKQRVQRSWRRRSWGGAASVLLAAAATLVFLMRPWHPTHPGNDCDVESLDFHGAFATVMQVQDLPHSGDGNTTIIWSEED